MRRYPGWICLMFLALTAWGCGKTESPQQDAAVTPGNSAQKTSATEVKPTVKPEGPAAVVQVFLEAIRTGNDEQASAMISTVARQKTAALGGITPPASDTAKFSLGKVEYVGEDGARVASVWTDLDEEGQAQSTETVWVLRKEDEAWRVAGVAAMVFPGEEPLLLNFEDPEDMKRKQEEVRNRLEHSSEASAAENLQAEKKANTENSKRR